MSLKKQTTKQHTVLHCIDELHVQKKHSILQAVPTWQWDIVQLCRGMFSYQLLLP